jgi:hypothetical protein
MEQQMSEEEMKNHGTPRSNSAFSATNDEVYWQLWLRHFKIPMFFFNQNVPVIINILFTSTSYFSLLPETKMNSPIYIQLIFMNEISPTKQIFIWKEMKAA